MMNDLTRKLFEIVTSETLTQEQQCLEIDKIIAVSKIYADSVSLKDLVIDVSVQENFQWQRREQFPYSPASIAALRNNELVLKKLFDLGADLYFPMYCVTELQSNYKMARFLFSLADFDIEKTFLIYSYNTYKLIEHASATDDGEYTECLILCKKEINKFIEHCKNWDSTSDSSTLRESFNLAYRADSDYLLSYIADCIKQVNTKNNEEDYPFLYDLIIFAKFYCDLPGRRDQDAYDEFLQILPELQGYCVKEGAKGRVLFKTVEEKNNFIEPYLADLTHETVHLFADHQKADAKTVVPSALILTLQQTSSPLHSSPKASVNASQDNILPLDAEDAPSAQYNK
jgi:hypothetical protein